ncbi:hypothetical protein RJ639_030489 [Escallonia herrerae]|uniref:TCP domain-containing protein n=1 Tax=Escallonia herrerae TaxID=1293975 RepID=A0AA89BHM1_9ASTE|nr:hypothetical protein RJ639_030489 [Escallonia herrerae]
MVPRHGLWADLTAIARGGRTRWSDQDCDCQRIWCLVNMANGVDSKQGSEVPWLLGICGANPLSTVVVELASLDGSDVAPPGWLYGCERMLLEALQMAAVEDGLGYDRPSKAVDWLINKAKNAIAKLDELPE